MPLTTGLESYWKCDEASGDLLDAHGSNALTDNNTVGSGTGKIGNARDFERDGSEYFSRDDNADLSIGDVDATLQVWVKIESKSSGNNIIGKWANPTLEYILYFDNASDKFRFGVTHDNSTYVDVAGSVTPSLDTWYLIHCWHDAANNQIGISIDAGTPVLTSHSLGVYDGSSPFRISAAGGQNPWDGLIDEVGFWKRVLTSDERTSLYNGDNGLAYPFLTASSNAFLNF